MERREARGHDRRLAVEHVLGRLLLVLEIPDQRDAVRLVRSLRVAVVAGEQQLGELGRPVQARDGAVARPAFLGELATDAEVLSGVRRRQTSVAHVVGENVDVLRYGAFHDARRSVEEMDEVRRRYHLEKFTGN